MRRRTQALAVLVGALMGGAYWAGVRPSGYGSGPSMGLLWGFYWLLLVWWAFPGERC
jgi:hypothetical protein